LELSGLPLVFKYLLSPFDSIEGTLIVSLKPLVDAVHVEMVATLSLDGRAVLTCVLALRAWHFERVHAYNTVGVTDVPVPGGHCKPTVNCHFHV
jgi:hypothetical protein